MITNMNEDILTIKADMKIAHGRLEDLRINLENNRKSNAKQMNYPTQVPDEDESSFLSAASSTQKFSSSNGTTAVNSIVFVPLVHLMSESTVPDPAVILKSRMTSKRVKLNVGGVR